MVTALPDSHYQELAVRIAGLLAALPQVEAVALGGSLAGSQADAASDIDLYVFTGSDIDLAARTGILEASGGASVANLGLTFWGPGDEWFDATTGIEVDLVYFDTTWMQDELRQVLDQCRASLGYSTCFWHTLRQATPLFDRSGWLAALQRDCRRDYPEALRWNIVALNHPVLRGVIPAYSHQIAKALKRRDAVSVNHRLSALLASYFDIIFAVNRVPHPGEKRLVAQAQMLCPRLPENMADDIEALLACPPADLLPHLDRLLDRLDVFLAQDELLPDAAL